MALYRIHHSGVRWCKREIRIHATITTEKEENGQIRSPAFCEPHAGTTCGIARNRKQEQGLSCLGST